MPEMSTINGEVVAYEQLAKARGFYGKFLQHCPGGSCVDGRWALTGNCANSKGEEDTAEGWSDKGTN